MPRVSSSRGTPALRPGVRAGGEGIRSRTTGSIPSSPIVWDGIRTALPRTVEPSDTVEVEMTVVAPRPHGSRLAFDLVEEHLLVREIGSTTLDIPVDVKPRIAERRLQVVLHGSRTPETTAALFAAGRSRSRLTTHAFAHLVPGALPAPDWSRLVLDAHEEGYAAVGPALETSRGDRRRFAAWAPGAGRNPRFDGPLLLLPSSPRLEPQDADGLPSYSGADSLFEERAVVRLRRSVVRAAEDERPGREPHHRCHRRVQRLRELGKLAVEEHVAHRLDGQREEVQPVNRELGRQVVRDPRELVEAVRIGVRKNHGSSRAVSRCSTSRKSAFNEAIASATPATMHAKSAPAETQATVSRASGSLIKLSTTTTASMTPNPTRWWPRSTEERAAEEAHFADEVRILEQAPRRRLRCRGEEHGRAVHPEQEQPVVAAVHRRDPPEQREHEEVDRHEDQQVQERPREPEDRPAVLRPKIAAKRLRKVRDSG